MSYIPPHKRHSKDPAKPTPVPDSLVTKFKKKPDFTSTSDKCDRIYKWFTFGSNGIEDEVPSYVKLVPLTSDSVERRNGEKPFVLMNNNVQRGSGLWLCVLENEHHIDAEINNTLNMNIGESEEEKRTKWLLVAEKVEEDLMLAYERAKTEMEGHHLVFRLTASFGRNFFYRRQGYYVDECLPKNLNKMFSSDVPTSFLQHIKSKVVPSHGFCIDSEKERYIVKVSHDTRPGTICCKCILNEDGRLSMYKRDLCIERHLVVDVSCIDKNLDMRLLLGSKIKLRDLSEQEISNIKALLDSATVDPNVKGGLRWPLGKALSVDGYRVFEVGHVRSTIYKNQTIRLRVRDTDRFNENIGTGVIHREVMLMLKDLNTKLQEQNIERDRVLEMLRDTLGTLWDFLHYDAYLT